MAIDPLILLPAAALAVLIVILVIRLVAGRRDAELTAETVAQFLSQQEPGEMIASSVISNDGKYALVRWRNSLGVGLIRSFGNTLVLQTLGAADIEKTDWRQDGELYIPRQGFAFPSVTFAASETDRTIIEAMINGGKDAAA
ncbi:hypothetical protein [Sneathiella sp.]|uniref:hypothetical protein n=1 Tax=Sneathiella sp. TaxID=1964365 RepID=UPI002636E6B8|nr:hypothetical protein [Sneathiella sp.]MDF2366800.1 hypothetical protein [Sneathiella sp.]